MDDSDLDFSIVEPEGILCDDELARAEECALEGDFEGMEEHLQNAKYAAMGEKRNVADRMNQIRGVWEDSEKAKAAIDELNNVAMNRTVDIDSERRSLMIKLLGMKYRRKA